MTAPDSTRPLPDRARLLRRIWRALTPEERTQAVRAGARDGGPAFLQGLRASVVKSLRMRPVTVQAWSVAQLADATAKVNLDEGLIADLLIAFHLGERVPLLSAFLDAAGVAHTAGVTDGDTRGLDPARVLGAADEVLQRFPEHECRIYFGTLIALEGGAWEALAERLDDTLLG